MRSGELPVQRGAGEATPPAACTRHRHRVGECGQPPGGQSSVMQIRDVLSRSMARTGGLSHEEEPQRDGDKCQGKTPGPALV
ncbi:hypothetical protein VULLAG_LOCUS12363 [Vulpes lagopus]